jgi:CheY-like chemotaxis protein
MSSIETAWVLVIEDLRDQAELCADVCAEAGLNTMTAANGGQGLRKASELQPSIILLDLMLPDIDGWEVCRRLKDDGRTRDIPIVILTARDESHAVRRSREAGCAAYLKKPCAPSELIAVLKRVLAAQAAV